MGDEFTLEEVPEYAPIPEGEILKAEVVKVSKQIKPWKDDNGNDIEKVVFEFRITEEGEWKSRRVWGETPVTFNSHSDCKLRFWVQELLGEDSLPGGFKFDTDMLEGIACRIAIANRTNKTGKVREYATDVMRTTRVPTTADIF